MSEWIENTGTMPVEGHVFVNVMTKFGEFDHGAISENYAAEDWFWPLEGGITHWKLAPNSVSTSSGQETNPKQIHGQSSLPLHLFSPLATAYGCIGKLNGKLKYGLSNFVATPVIASIYVDAIRRHLDKWMSGQENDDVDGVPHFAAILANVDILLCARAAGTLIDDRPMSVGYLDEIEKLTPLVRALHELHKDKQPKHYTLADNP